MATINRSETAGRTGFIIMLGRYLHRYVAGRQEVRTQKPRERKWSRFPPFTSCLSVRFPEMVIRIMNHHNLAKTVGAFGGEYDYT